MEDFLLLRGDQTLSSSRVQINNALSSVRSLSSGTTFPVDNLHEGMLCYRTDERKVYQYDGEAWQEEVAIKAKSAVYDADGNKIDSTTYIDLTSTQSIAGLKLFTNGLQIPAGVSVSWFAGNPAQGQIAGSIHNGEYTGNSATATKLKNTRKINGVDFDGTENITTSSFSDVSVAGKTLTFTAADGTTKTVNTQDTTYANATTSKAGLLSTADKKKLDSITANTACKLPYATCSTAANTKAKVATILNDVSFSLVRGAFVVICTSNTFSGEHFDTNANLTLNVNSTGAKPLYHNESTTSWGYSYSGGSYNYYGVNSKYVMCVYDGSAWRVLNYVEHRSGNSGN